MPQPSAAPLLGSTAAPTAQSARDARLEALTHQLRTGTLPIDPASIADAIVARSVPDLGRDDALDEPANDAPATDARLALGAYADLESAVLAGFLHDIASPLAATSSNLSVARELAEQPTASSLAELHEVLDDLTSAAARIADLCADLRAYGTTTSPPATAAALVRSATRMARAHLSRRAALELRIATTARPRDTSSNLVRALADALVAITPDAATDPLPALVMETEPTGLRVSLTPGRVGPRLRRRVEAAFAVHELPHTLDEEGGSLVLRIAIRWSP